MRFASPPDEKCGLEGVEIQTCAEDIEKRLDVFLSQHYPEGGTGAETGGGNRGAETGGRKPETGTGNRDSLSFDHWETGGNRHSLSF